MNRGFWGTACTHEGTRFLMEERVERRVLPANLLLAWEYGYFLGSRLCNPADVRVGRVDGNRNRLL